MTEFEEIIIIKSKEIIIDSLVTYIFENMCNGDKSKLKIALEKCNCFDDETIEAYCTD